MNLLLGHIYFKPYFYECGFRYKGFLNDTEEKIGDSNLVTLPFISFCGHRKHALRLQLCLNKVALQTESNVSGIIV